MKDKGSNMQIDILDAMKANIEALGIQVMYLKSPYEISGKLTLVWEASYMVILTTRL